MWLAPNPVPRKRPFRTQTKQLRGTLTGAYPLLGKARRAQLTIGILPKRAVQRGYSFRSELRPVARHCVNEAALCVMKRSLLYIDTSKNKNHTGKHNKKVPAGTGKTKQS